MLDKPSGLLSDYDAALNVPLLQWLITEDLLVLFPLFWFYVTTYGYGHPSEVPAIYALKYLPTGFFLAFVNGGSPTSTLRQVFFQSLLEAMVSTLQGHVVLDAEIEHVSYTSKSNMLTYRTGGGKLEDMECGSTIIAFAPTASAMVQFTPRKHADELTSLFKEIKTVNYRTTLFNDNTGDFASGAKVAYRFPNITGLPDNPAKNLLYSKLQPFLESMVVGYYLSPSEKSDEEALEESLESYGTKIGKEVTSEIVEDFNSWVDYFPHVSQTSLDAKFYNRFDSFQGHANQYYVGGLFNFEMVQDSMEHAKSILERFF